MNLNSVRNYLVAHEIRARVIAYPGKCKVVFKCIDEQVWVAKLELERDRPIGIHFYFREMNLWDKFKTRKFKVLIEVRK
jgi:hypothetical protein